MKGGLTLKGNEVYFGIKLYELEQQYGLLQSRLRCCQQGDHARIRHELQKAQDEQNETACLLQQNVEKSHSPAVVALSKIHQEYHQKMMNLLDQVLPEYLHSEFNTRPDDRVEAAALYAEYAIDYATQSNRYALIAALKAIDVDMSAKEEREGQTNHE